jgi:hypothetical protein
MKRFVILLVLLGAIAFLVGRLAPPFVGHAAAAPAPGNASASGSYAFSESTHDANTGQEGAAVGTMVFDGVGNVSGTFSANYRFNPPCTTCGDLLITHAPYTGTYSVRSDGSVLIDMCISNPSGPVRVIVEGAFSNGFRSLRFLVSEIGTTLSCSAALTQVPNTTTGTADKL